MIFMIAMIYSIEFKNHSNHKNQINHSSDNKRQTFVKISNFNIYKHTKRYIWELKHSYFKLLNPEL
jgi:hypothetical protein